MEKVSSCQLSLGHFAQPTLDGEEYLGQSTILSHLQIKTRERLRGGRFSRHRGE